MYLKNEISLLLNRKVNGERDHTLVNSPSERYVDSLWILLRNEKSDKKEAFIKLYLSLLNNTNLEVLKVNLVVSMYYKWINYPMLFKDINLIIRRIGLKDLDQEFWSLVIENSMLDKPIRSLHLARLHLLIHAIKAGMIYKKELVYNGLLVKTLLKLNINSINQILLKKGFNKLTTHYYRCMFFLVRNLIDNKVDNLTIAEIIQIHFSQTENSLEWNNHTKQFFEVLDKKLPKDYLLYVTKYEIKKIYFLYTYQSTLFERFNKESLTEINIKSIVEILFQDYMFSRSFLYSFVNERFNSQEIKWFVFELTGKSIVYADDLPFKLTKKAAHFFRCMNEDIGLSVTRTLIYAQIFSLIENKPFALAVAHSIRNLSELSFWIESMVIMYKKGLFSGDVREVMDYLNEIVFIQRTTIDLKNKSLENLKRDIEEWHRLLAIRKFEKSIPKKRINLPSAYIKEFLILNDDLVYCIKQIKTVEELFNEGKNLRHCVYSYKRDCIRKKAFIFSLRCFHPNMPESSIVTIELDEYNQIIQAKGKFNRPSTEDELSIIKMWADENSLSLAI
jgi:hypothetical protein